MMHRLARVATATTAVALLVASACGGPERHAGSVSIAGSGASGGFDGDVGGAPCVADGVCGNDVHQISLDVPNLYFVLDRSGSMAELVAPGSNVNRYAAVRTAALDLVRSLGPFINVGAAVFPYGDIEADACTDGSQVLPVTPGDPFDGDDIDGTTTKRFAIATLKTPMGGTPVAATLEKLAPTLASLSGRTFVLLLTDGGPNCNADATCGASECIPNIEGVCEPTENCCDPGHPLGGPENCLDGAATVTAVQAIADAGSIVHVIGIPGSATYATLLDQMAVAGGAAEMGHYLRVDDLDTLEPIFAKIASDAISCEIQLADPPTDKGFTNVYFDCLAVPYDSVDGWTWVGDDAVELHGDACARLKGGQVATVKVVSGCPTEIPK